MAETIEFTASNGIKIETKFSGLLYRDHRDGSRVHLGYTFKSMVDTAISEWYQDRRDEELGRWRWPDNPDYVVYRVPDEDDEDGRFVRVVNERTGESEGIWEKYVPRYTPVEYADAARAYFDEHTRKHWTDAKTGEVWVISVEGYTAPMAALVEGQKFVTQEYGYLINDERITSGRRIWPEQDETDA